MATARELATQIWRAGVDRVRAESLIAKNVHCEAGRLTICNDATNLSTVGRICIVGAGKAAGYLATELVRSLRSIATEKQLHGMVNVPDTCKSGEGPIYLYGARPAGVNEPTPEGETGTRQMLEMVGELEPNDLCICVLTGGGSALLPAPKPPVSLQDKLLVTRLLSARGASINELNSVRIALSEVKGGGLARHCRANKLVTLIVSDIIGDPLELIASGPTLSTTNTAHLPSDVLSKYISPNELAPAVWSTAAEWKAGPNLRKEQERKVHLLGNNQTAVEAACRQAEFMGLKTKVLEAESPQTTAEEVGHSLVKLFAKKVNSPCCILWGGEPVVRLSENAGRGGRNQHLALTVATQWEKIHAGNRERLCILSGGTDGEDGPTDAAGAFIDAQIVQTARDANLAADVNLRNNDAYPFFESAGGLFKTGLTHTNVCDLRVAVVT